MHPIFMTLIIAVSLAPAAHAQQSTGGGSTFWNPPVALPPILSPAPFPGSVDVSTTDTPAGNWSFSLPRPPLGAVTGPASTPFPFLIPPDLPNTAGSSWLGLPSTGSAYWQGGTGVTFSTSFSLVGATPGTAHIGGVWGVFGRPMTTAILALNGTDVGAIDISGLFPTELTDFSVSDQALFLPDFNTLSITFLTSPVSGDGALTDAVFRVEAAVTAQPVPAPGGAVVLIGLLGLAAGRMARTRHRIDG